VSSEVWVTTISKPSGLTETLGVATTPELGKSTAELRSLDALPWRFEPGAVPRWSAIHDHYNPDRIDTYVVELWPVRDA